MSQIAAKFFFQVLISKTIWITNKQILLKSKKYSFKNVCKSAFFSKPTTPAEGGVVVGEILAHQCGFINQPLCPSPPPRGDNETVRGGVGVKGGLGHDSIALFLPAPPPKPTSPTSSVFPSWGGGGGEGSSMWVTKRFGLRFSQGSPLCCTLKEIFSDLWRNELCNNNIRYINL